MTLDSVGADCDEVAPVLLPVMAETFSDGAGGARLIVCAEFLLGVEQTMDLPVVLEVLCAEPMTLVAPAGTESDLLARTAIGLTGCWKEREGNP